MRDLRAYGRQTSVRLAIGAFLLLLIVGLGLIYGFYGAPAAMVGLLCLLGGLVPIGLTALAFVILDKYLKNARSR